MSTDAVTERVRVNVRGLSTSPPHAVQVPVRCSRCGDEGHVTIAIQAGVGVVESMDQPSIVVPRLIPRGVPQ